MEVDPPIGSASSDTLVTDAEALAAEKILAAISEMFTLDIVFDSIAENEDGE